MLSRVVAVGSADMTTQVFSVPLLDKLHRFTLAGHGREIIGAFFEQDSLNVREEVLHRDSSNCSNLDHDDLQKCQSELLGGGYGSLGDATDALRSRR